MLRVGIDPGVANCGVAVLLGRRVIYAETHRLFTGSEIKHRLPMRIVVAAAAELVREVISKTCPPISRTNEGPSRSVSHLQVEQQLPNRPRELAIEYGTIAAGTALGIGTVRHVNARALKRKYGLGCEGHDQNKRNAVALVKGWVKGGELLWDGVDLEELSDHVSDAILVALFE